MSRTHHHSDPKRLWAAWFRNEIPMKSIPIQYHFDWDAMPSWWVKMTFHQPQRTLTKRLEQSIVKGRYEPDAVVWPHHKKPKVWYW